MVTRLRLGEIMVEVVQKDIKNVHLSVYPPHGRVKISAPSRMSEDTIRVFAVSKIGWIKQQQAKLRGQERESLANISTVRATMCGASAICLRWLKTKPPRALRFGLAVFSCASAPAPMTGQKKRSSQAGTGIS